MATIDITALSSTLRSYFKPQLGLKDMKQALMVPATFDAKWATLVPTQSEVAQMIKSDIGDVLQRFQVALTPQSGNVTFVPNERKLSKIKIEKEFSPDDIEGSYMAFMAKDTNKKEDWPITAYITKVLMVAKYRENWNLRVVYKGIEAPVVVGTAGTVEGTHDGLGIQITNDIDASVITPVNSGAVPTDPLDVVDWVRDWILAVKATSSLNRYIVENFCQDIFCDQATVDLYAAGLVEKYGVNFALTGQSLKGKVTVVDIPQTNLRLVGDSAMQGEDRLIMTPDWNRYNLIKNPNSESNFGIDISGRVLTPYADFWRQLSYWDGSYMFVNELSMIGGS
jgi:hypothetical protein